MAYLQITTRCNMACDHCCYSCRPGAGKHMDYEIVQKSINFIKDFDDYTISIGGGEPTLHPRFFDILRECLNTFENVWMATNGTNTKAMLRLDSIIQNYDYENFSEEEEHKAIFQDKKLAVALSQDNFHNSQKIVPKEHIVDLWKRKSKTQKGFYEIRNVTSSNDGVAASGRAKRTGAGWGEHCVCSDIIVKPSGDIKLCGCTNAPTIGNVFNGIESKWEKVFYSDKFNDTRCYNQWKTK